MYEKNKKKILFTMIFPLPYLIAYALSIDSVLPKVQQDPHSF